MNVPEHLQYTESHEWLRLDGETATVGITDHAQAELTDIVFVELPKVGASLTAGQAAAVVESVKAASDIYAPIGGAVVEANPALEGDPGLVNRDPYGEGWLFRLKVEAGEQIERLKEPAQYRELISASGKYEV
ncbi:MAG TPA: glycine cleavage system protein GcvH [Chthoniobacteraceae bacterium]|jgi:glycine cleavage system H protein|nr:glycine cleavage system protein GcvH [Chthoniobacteraceae bacterium]